MKITRQQRFEGEILPPFYYGYTRFDVITSCLYFHPIPINYIIRFFISAKSRWYRFRSKLIGEDVENMCIDWKSIRWRYNRDHNTKLGEREVLERVYERFGTLEKTARYLLVSRPALTKRFRQWKIPYKPKGWAPNSSKFYGLEMEGKTAPELARKTGLTLSAVHRYAKRYGIKLKLVRGERNGRGRTP